MQHIRSADGTNIAYEKLGSGAPLILLGGAFCDHRARAAGLPLARLLDQQHTVYCVDRRGRGASGDTAPYAAAREVEDLAAVIEAAGGSAFVYGHSSGAVLAFEGAAAGLSIRKLALYEPPLVLGQHRERLPPDLEQQLARLTAAGDRDGAATLFLTRAVGVPPSGVEQMKQAPVWQNLTALAHTLSYDACLTRDPESILARAAAIPCPAVLLAGGKSPAWMQAGVERLARAMPDAKPITLPEQTHDVDPRELAPRLLEAFQS
jgi:pimeloyl-ACP methyl ester carboxylesterase